MYKKFSSIGNKLYGDCCWVFIGEQIKDIETRQSSVVK